MRNQHVWPVSVKGVVLDSRRRLLLLRNERDEWELPGGRLEHDEDPAKCVVREIREESGWVVSAKQLLDAWVYEPIPLRRVLIITFGCTLLRNTVPALSNEHSDVGLFTEAEADSLSMPEGYKNSIRTWYAVLRQ